MRFSVLTITAVLFLTTMVSAQAGEGNVGINTAIPTGTFDS